MSSSSADSRLDLSEPSAVIWNPDSGEVETCFCGYPRLERISWRYKSAGRRFWNCPNSMTKRPKCNYFEWKDPKLEPTQNCYKQLLLTMKGELDMKENWSELTYKRRKLDELELQLAHEKLVFEKELLQLKQENEVMKLENGGLKVKNSGLKKWLSFVVLLLVGMIACVMKMFLE